MGVTGVPAAIGLYGEMFKGIPKKEPPLRPETLLGPDGPLSAGLAAVQNLKAFAAADFGRTKDQGIAAAGDGLILIGTRLEEFDRQGADGIARLFPVPAPGAGGGQ
jgi:hypothetical protein